MKEVRQFNSLGSLPLPLFLELLLKKKPQSNWHCKIFKITIYKIVLTISSEIFYFDKELTNNEINQNNQAGIKCKLFLEETTIHL